MPSRTTDVLAAMVASLPRVADEPLRAQVVITGDFVIPELLSLDGHPHHVGGGGEGNRVRHPGQTRRNVDSELHMSTMTWSMPAPNLSNDCITAADQRPENAF